MSYFRETQRVARRIKRLEDRLEYLFTSLNNDAMSDSKRNNIRAEHSALDWALKHIEKTRQIAFDDARAIDLANPEYIAECAAREEPAQ